MFFAWFVFYLPDFLGHPDNYVPANPLKTPAHIVPEWYFLPFYAILRAITFNIGIPFTDIVLIDSKLGGVIAMFASIAVLFFLPWLDTSPVKSANYRPLYRQFFWIFVIVCIALGYLGSRPAEGIYPLLSLLFTIYYFAHFFIILPLLGWFETPKERPASIADAVLASQMKHGTSISAQPAE
jgi:ubiquinol-cytochrome c reductase cytochrome b subunit